MEPVRAIYPVYSSLCHDTAVGKSINTDMPEQAIIRLDEVMGGKDIDMVGGKDHPDNMWATRIGVLSDHEVIVNITKMLDDESYNNVVENHNIEEWISDYLDEIGERLNDIGTFLTRTGTDSWWCIDID